MSNYHTPKKPTPEQLELIKERYEVSGAGLVVKNKYHCGPEVGEPAGSIQGTGYLALRVSGRSLSVHHVVWLLTYGEWPEQPIDHIDGNKVNNAPDNLRLSSNSHNQKAYAKTHGSVGYRGVCLDKNRGKYKALAALDGKLTHIGRYDTPEEAAIARDLKCYKDFDYPWEGLNEIGQEYILKHHPEWIKDGY